MSEGAGDGGRGAGWQEALAATVAVEDATQLALLEAAATIAALEAALARAGVVAAGAGDARRRDVIEAALTNPTGPGVRVQLGAVEDKYKVVGAVGIDCNALLPLCHARCCSYPFSLTTQDLDEGVVRWEYGRPYLIRHSRETGYCTHLRVPDGKLDCAVYHNRPATCRHYDCRNDPRVWIDYDRRIPAPLDLHLAGGPEPGPDVPTARLRRRSAPAAPPPDGPLLGDAVERWGRPISRTWLVEAGAVVGRSRDAEGAAAARAPVPTPPPPPVAADMAEEERTSALALLMEELSLLQDLPTR